MSNPIKVLIVDDSAVVRQVLSSVIDSDPDLEVIGSAMDPYIAARKIKEQVPDVITLDVEMPKMDGLTFLQKIMSQHPMPVVMCSSLTHQGCEVTFKALEYGAVDIITKPSMGIKQFFEESKIKICDAIKAASKARLKPFSQPSSKVTKKYTADVVLPNKEKNRVFSTTEKVVAVGASTGGTEAIRALIESLPHDTPGMVIVQHMPEYFTGAFARRLNDLSYMQVKEAEDGDKVVRGTVLIAPGNKHMLLKRSGAKYYVAIQNGQLVCRHRPSVEVLFRSAAQIAGPNALGIILTGMGDDGAHGLLEMKESGSITIAQDEESSVVFGMPREAIKLGAADKVLPLDNIPGAILQVFSNNSHVN